MLMGIGKTSVLGSLSKAEPVELCVVTRNS